MSDTPLTDSVHALCVRDDETQWKHNELKMSRLLRHALQLERDRAYLLTTLRALVTEMESQMPPLKAANAPGHAHEIPGIWDASGERCHWCHLWLRVKWCLEKFRAEEAHHES